MQSTTSEEGLTILSANCKRLCDHLKRKDVFSFIRAKQFSIYCLQDTHFTEEKQNIIRNEWGLDSYFSSFKSNARGVAILLNINFEFKVHKEKKDKSGNFLALDIEIEGTRITLVTFYGPNLDNPDFYNIIPQTIEEFQNKYVIVCGDFNLVLNPKLDYDGNHKYINNPKAREKVIEIIENYALIDIFREHHPDIKRYTWRKRNPLKQARLDFFLVSENVLPSAFFPQNYIKIYRI